MATEYVENQRREQQPSPHHSPRRHGHLGWSLRPGPPGTPRRQHAARRLGRHQQQEPTHIIDLSGALESNRHGGELADTASAIVGIGKEHG